MVFSVLKKVKILFSMIKQFFSKNKSKLAISHQLLRDLVILVVLLGIALGTLSLVLEVRSRNHQARDLTNQAVQKAKQQFIAKIKPVQSMLKVISKWGEDGQLDLVEPSTLNGKFIPMLEERSGVAALAIADNNGGEYLLLPQRRGWLTRTRNSSQEENNFLWQRWLSANKSIQSWNEELNRDSDQKKWYQQYDSDKGNSKLVWSVPYNFSENTESGIIAITSFSSSNKPEPESVSVARIDLQLSDILQDTETLYSKDKSGTFLISPERQIVTSNRNDKQSRVQFLAASKWSEKDEQKSGTFSVKVQGKTWWCGFLPLDKNSDAGWIGVTIPESDLLADSEQTSWAIAIWVFAALVLGVFLSLILVRRYKKYFREASANILNNADIVQQIKALIAQGENPGLEFKSTVRTNLKTGKKDKAIEIAWLKTLAAFLNTQGGILLIGVDDACQVLGLEADNFKSDDKCRLHIKNLIHRHIGPAFSHFIHFDIVHYQGARIIVFECAPASKPVFLYNGQGEEFFIRSGPASIPLTISQTINYLQYGPKKRH
ncbi:MAG: RNA-binding domain-containing protein [Thermodesulfobacteriota bacterium]